MPARLLTDPQHEEIAAAALAVLLVANGRARRRRVEWSEEIEVACDAAAQDDEGIYETDGGSVVNSYRDGAYTTRFTLAWHHDGRSRRVTVAAFRLRARRTPFGNGPGAARYRGETRAYVDAAFGSEASITRLARLRERPG